MIDFLLEIGSILLQLRTENKLTKSSVMVTSGANQAFVNLVLTLCDAGDSVVMFAPYYFNSYMSFQMTGVTDILIGASNPETLHPDVDWLEKVLQENNPIPKLVNVVNPGNPSGAFIPKPMLQRISDLCRDAGAWLVLTIPMSLWNDGVACRIPDGLHAQLLKVQDNIPICASIIGQHLALYSLEAVQNGSEKG
ncbi:hypothetical protein GUJ93_ZPchr0001g31526 [Zizania palustris]|uniref:Aminotransferase class I/classII large domain-containing protein n=1 Tax=Zizania palustris TaxID=103762 RepID=A0A8J5S1D0_ZIZPA|nr:hypothetical protein GUJ93_ZPchr0001g31526 [Zizania palustris]